MTGSGGFAPELERIVDFPWEVLEYLSWVRREGAPRGTSGYSFEQPEVRFSLVDGDLLVSEPNVRVMPEAQGLRLISPRVPQSLLLEGSPAESELVASLLASLDGTRALGAVRAPLPAAAATLLERLLSVAFGKLVFAPLAILEAERRISGAEITRFPGSPYEIARAYWRNMGGVRAASDALFEALDDDARFARELRKLHVIALMGEDLSSYYLPASPIASNRAAPGRFMLTAPELLEHPGGTLFVAGPRVNAAAVGGEHYHAMLYETVGDPRAAEPRQPPEADGLDWGRVVRARASGDADAALWFCPPRPLRSDHVRTLRERLAAAHAAAGADRAACLSALAAFHRGFVRLHPFHCGNQSLAMNLVNRVATRALGAGLPHLMLDHLALRLAPGAYARVFERAARAYGTPASSPAGRYLELASHRTRTFELLRQIEAAPTPAAAWELARADAEGARLLLLTGP